MALSAEVAEIVEHFQWLTEEQSKNLKQVKLDEVETELADTLIYLIRLADKLDINLLTAAQRKIEVNERKYPVEKAKGSAKKYTEYVWMWRQKVRPVPHVNKLMGSKCINHRILPVILSDSERSYKP